MMKYIGYGRNIVQKILLWGVLFSVLVLLPALGLLNTRLGRAQSITDYDGPRLTFESISIRPYERKPLALKPGVDGMLPIDQLFDSMVSNYEPRYQPGGRFVNRSVTLASLIISAYGIESFKLSGTPSWGRSLQFNIEAEAGYDAGEDEIKLMIRSLLEDRFGLKIRREMRDVPFYSLEVSESGHKLQPALDENGNHMLSLPKPESGMPANAAGVIGGLLSTPTSLEELELRRKELELRPGALGTRSLEDGGIYFYGTAVSIDYMVKSLNRESVYKEGTEKYRIIDRTGLDGLYTFKMEYYSTGGSLLSRGTLLLRSSNPASDGKLAGPSLSEAFEQQLGLKMRLDHGPIELFVIDAAHEPVMDE